MIMKETLAVALSLIIIVFSLIGLADASYITYERFSGVIPPCGQGFDCESVLNSEWSSIGPIPLSLLGMLFYSTVFVVGIAHYLQLDLSPAIKSISKPLNIKRSHTLNLVTPIELLLLITTFGALFSLYLIFLMAVIIKAWCLYCVISAFTSMGLFIAVALYHHQVSNHSPFLMKTLVGVVFYWFYTTFLKRIFFARDPEVVHNAMTRIGEMIGTFGPTKSLTSAAFSFSHPSLGKTINGITFPNPIGLAAGFDYNGQLTQTLPAVGFGFHTIGSVTFQPYAGNTPPRLGRLIKSQGLLVNKGLKSWGAPTVIRKLEQLNFEIPVGISIASTNTLFESDKDQIMDIMKCFQLFERSKVQHSYYELNISCPNTFGGEPFTTPNRLNLLLQALDKLGVTRPIYIKMPIDQSDDETLALLKVINQHQIAGMVLGNLTKNKNNPAVHPEDKKIWQKQPGNVSGKPTFSRSNHLIKLAKKKYGSRFTIIGTGGIFSPEDVELKLENGADLVQLITGMIFQGPQLIGQINNQLARKRVLTGN
jgi:dihydroorotate dehydrogenase